MYGSPRGNKSEISSAARICPISIKCGFLGDSAPKAYPSRSYNTTRGMDSTSLESRGGALAEIPILAAPPPQSAKAPRKKPLSPHQKVDKILEYIGHLGWGISDFLYFLFLNAKREPPSNPKASKPKKPLKNRPQRRHYHVLTKFLRGQCHHRISEILELIYNHPLGKPKREDAERPLHFPGPEYGHPISIKHARPSLQAWAVQKVTEEARHQVRSLAGKDAGLHVRPSWNGRKSQDEAVVPTWTKIHELSAGEGEWILGLIRTRGPLLWDLVLAMLESSRRPQTPDDEAARRSMDPVRLKSSSRIKAYTD